MQFLPLARLHKARKFTKRWHNTVESNMMKSDLAKIINKRCIPYIDYHSK
jgi:hypothetical protein